MAVTYPCSVVWGDKVQSRAFIKCFCLSKYLGVINEITGYLIAKTLNISVPDRAAIVQLTQTLKVEMGENSSEEKYYDYAFVVSEAPGKSPNTLLKDLTIPEVERIKLLKETLDGWSGLPRLIAFDDWVANQDRNLGNFLICSDGNVSVIDHSNLPVDIIWHANQLDARSDYRNVLIEILGVVNGVSIESAFLDRAAAQHPIAFNSIKAELVKWWNAFLVGDPARRSALEEFITLRSEFGYKRASMDAVDGGI